MAIKKLVRDQELKKKKYFLSTDSARITYANPYLMNSNYILAYSLRNIGSYNGPVVRIRRGSDSSEVDMYSFNIGPDLINFVGTGSNDHGFVSKWYDQSLSQNHAYTTTLSEQPILVMSGSLLSRNSRPSVRFNNSSLNMTFTSSVIDQSIYATIAPESSITPEAVPAAYLLISQPPNKTVGLTFGQFSSTETSEVITWTDTVTSPFSNRAVYSPATMGASLQLLQAYATPASTYFSMNVNRDALSLWSPTPSPHGILTSTRYPATYNKFFTVAARPIYCSELILYNINTVFVSGSSTNLYSDILSDIINYYGIT